MFNFAYPIHLYLLALVPVLLLMYLAARAARRRKIRRFGRPETVARLMPDASRYTPGVRIALQLLALTALVVILARPRTQGQAVEETSAGIEVMIAFDLSNSMNASSTDSDNGTTRLARATLLLERLIDRLDNDKVGLVIFAGDAKTQLPLTSDFYTAKMYLSELNPSMMSYQGTDIASAIRMAMNGFSGLEDMSKAIILITDAEDHEGAAVQAARTAAQNGIQVDVVGVGTAEGALVPGVTDSQGQAVRSALNERLAQEIARAGDGVYVNGSASNALTVLTDQLDTLATSEINSVRYSAASEQFPTFAVIALILLVVDTLVVDRKISWLRGIEFFSREGLKKFKSDKKGK